MKNTGFTLIELLGVVVILALIMLLIFPNIINSLKKSRDEVDSETKKLIYNATDLYIKETKTDYKKLKGATYCITLTELVDNGYLKEPLTLSDGKTNIKGSKKVEIKYNSTSKKFDYDLKDNNNCNITQPYICEAVTEETKTTGNVSTPTDNYGIGDEYVCEVSPGVEYHFFIVSTYNDSLEITDNSEEVEFVNLIMDSNIDKFGKEVKGENQKTIGVPWLSIDDCLKEENCNFPYWDDWDTEKTYPNSNVGPITAIKFLNNATLSWTNIPNLNEVYIDESGSGYTINLTGKARLLKKIEAKKAGCESIQRKGDYLPNLSNVTNGLATCPLWLVDYTKNCRDDLGTYCANLEKNCKDYSEKNFTEQTGYWMMSTLEESETVVNAIGYCGDIDGENDTFVTNSRLGIRPVISIPIEYIKN